MAVVIISSHLITFVALRITRNASPPASIDSLLVSEKIPFHIRFDSNDFEFPRCFIEKEVRKKLSGVSGMSILSLSQRKAIHSRGAKGMYILKRWLETCSSKVYSLEQSRDDISSRNLSTLQTEKLCWVVIHFPFRFKDSLRFNEIFSRPSPPTLKAYTRNFPRFQWKKNNLKYIARSILILSAGEQFPSTFSIEQKVSISSESLNNSQQKCLKCLDRRAMPKTQFH